MGARFLEAAVVVLLAVSTVNGRLQDRVARTDFAAQLTGGPVPHPTAAVEAHEVIRRQESDTSSYVVWMATDKTCGYLSGSAGAALTCGTASTCFFAPEIGARMCCGFDECDSLVDCLDVADANDPEVCNDVCQANSFLLKCDVTYPYCRTLVYPSGISDYACFRSPGPSIASVDFTYSGWAREFPLITTTLTPTGTDDPLVPTTLPIKSDFSSRSSSSVDPTSSTTPTHTVEPEPEKPNKTGTIVSGTIGGLFAVGLAVLAALFLIRRKKQSKPTPPESMASPAPMMQPYTFPSPTSPQPQSPRSMDDNMRYSSTPRHMSPVQDEGLKFQPTYQTTRMGAPLFQNSPPMHPRPFQPQPMQPSMQPPMQPEQPMWQAPQQPQPQQGPVYEVGQDTEGHHRGNIHKI